MAQPLWEKIWRFLRKLKIELPYDPFLGIYSDKTITQNDTCTPIFIAALFTIAKKMETTWMSLNRSMDEDVVYTYMIENHKKEWNAICSNLEIVILNEVKSERERQVPYAIIYVWSLKYDTNELTYETETESWT